MNQFSRVIEPDSTPQQELALQQYKKYMGSGISPFLSCINIIPSAIIDEQGEGLQIIDLGGGNGDFCKLMKKKLSKAKILCVDTNINGKEDNNGGVQMIGDTLLHVKKYIDTTSRYTLLICIDTIHHLDNPGAFFDLISSLPKHIGLYIKDYIRPIDYEQLETKMNILSTCISVICRKDITTATHVINLSKQSLLASLCKDEIINHTNKISGVIYKETNSSITYEVTRDIQK